MPGHAASTPGSALILMKADAKAAAATSLVWVRLAPPTKELVRSPSPKVAAASPVEPARSLKSLTAQTAVENSEASTALVLESIAWPGVLLGVDACTTTNEVQCNGRRQLPKHWLSLCHCGLHTLHRRLLHRWHLAQLEEAVCLSVAGTFGGAGVDCGSCSCEQPCPEDLDNNGAVDFNDILSLLAAWGPCGTCNEDIDDNGTVDFADLLGCLLPTVIVENRLERLPEIPTLFDAPLSEHESDSCPRLWSESAGPHDQLNQKSSIRLVSGKIVRSTAVNFSSKIR